MLWGTAMGAELANDRQRARFEAVRRRVFEEMQDAASRKRTTMMVPFQVIVVAILAFRGAPPVRLGIQIAAFAMCLVTMSISERTRGAARRARVPDLGPVHAGERRQHRRPREPAAAQPGAVSRHATSMNPNLDRKRPAVLGVFLLGFVVMASFSNTAIGELCGPLAPHVHWAQQRVRRALVRERHDGRARRLQDGPRHQHRLRAHRPRARGPPRRALRRERRSHARPRRHRRAPRPRGEEPARRHQGLSTHVARNSTDEKVSERLTIVASEAERLQEIVEGFLSFSRGLDDLTVGPTKPYDIARELSLLLETRAADAGVTLEVRGSRELTLNADDKKLRQALLNLVLNAMQASTRGTTVTLEVAKSCSDGAAVIRVMDRGAGMAPEILDRIPKPYYTTKEGGSGLGIAVARGIIEQHGGSLRFESTPGRGTTATVHLPACALKAQSKKAKLPNPCHGRARARAVHGRRRRGGRVTGQPGKSPFLSVLA